MSSLTARTSLMERAASQDNFIVIIALIAAGTVNPSTPAFVAFLLAYCWISLKNFAEKKHVKGFESRLSIPPNTYVVEKPLKGFFSYIINKFDDPITISLPKLNVVFLPQHFLDHGLTDTKKAILHHEFGHCFRYDILFIFVSILVIFKFLQMPITIYFRVENWYESNIPIYPILMILLGGLVALNASRIFHRREFIADTYAFNAAPDLYRSFLEEMALQERMSAPAENQTFFRKVISKLWHPTWEERHLFQTNGTSRLDRPSLTYAFLWSFTIAMLVSHMSLPRLIFGSISSFFAPVAAGCLVLVLMFCTKLVYSYYTFPQHKNSLAHTLVLTLGFSCFWILLVGVEEFYVEGETYSFWDYPVVPLTLFYWLAGLHLLQRYSQRLSPRLITFTVCSGVLLIGAITSGFGTTAVMDHPSLSQTLENKELVFYFIVTPILALFQVSAVILSFAILWIDSKVRNFRSHSQHC